MHGYLVIVFYSVEDEVYIADIPDMKYCSAFGDTPEQALAELRIASTAWLEVAAEHRDKIPPAKRKPDFYGVGSETTLDAETWARCETDAGGGLMREYIVVVFYSEEDEAYIADIADLKYCSAFGDTPEQALAELRIASAAWLDAVRENGKPMPPAKRKQELYGVASD